MFIFVSEKVHVLYFRLKAQLYFMYSCLKLHLNLD